jgi:3-dehydroquinate dehydratase-2
MAKILVIHGPNLNLLGTREPNLYGAMSLSDINSHLVNQAQTMRHQLNAQQSNSEADIIGYIQQAPHENIDFIIINPAAFTHTSIAIRDAFLAVKIPFIEVHLSNVHARESFRQQSFLSDIALGVISGLGADSYFLALTAAERYLAKL